MAKVPNSVRCRFGHSNSENWCLFGHWRSRFGHSNNREALPRSSSGIVPLRFATGDRAHRTPNTIVAVGSDTVVATVDRLPDEAHAAVGHRDNDAAGVEAAD